jgi:exonuclease SbcD
VLVDLSPGALGTEHIPAPVTKALAILRGDLRDLLHDRRHHDAETAYCQITLTDAVRPMGAMESVRRRFPDTLVLAFEPVGAQVIPATNAASMHHRGDLDLCSDFLAHVRAGTAASGRERALLATAVEHARVAGADNDNQARVVATGSAA